LSKVFIGIQKEYHLTRTPIDELIQIKLMVSKALPEEVDTSNNPYFKSMETNIAYINEEVN
jgi:hypothetical protein